MHAKSLHYPSNGRGGKSVAILSFTPITDEPRVLRQVAALQADGWHVTLCGFKGRQAPRSRVRLIEVDQVILDTPITRRISSEMNLVLSRFSQSCALKHYWNSMGYAGILEHLMTVEPVKADLYVAHDFFTAPIAYELVKQFGGAWTIDAHEYATEQYMHDPVWRFVTKPWVHSLQSHFYPLADSISTVCGGIAELLNADYNLEPPAFVLRSVATYRELPFRPTGEVIRVLYHGIVSPMRGLEQAIASVPHWRSEFVFQIRGPGPEDYLSSLRALAQRHGVVDRVEILPPVTFDDMVPMANQSDVGFFVQPDISPQKRFTLPNKLFEYIMAGLAICVADLPEMARIVEDHDLGKTVSGLEPEKIAQIINSFDPKQIDAFKRNALESAKTLNWEAESRVMIENYNAIVSATAKQSSSE